MKKFNQDTKNNLVRMLDLVRRLEGKINFLLSGDSALENGELVEMYVDDTIGLAKKIGQMVEAD